MPEIFIVVIATVVSPLLLATVTFTFQRHTRRRQWAREDEVAARVAEVALAAKATSAVVDQVHDLVNSEFSSLKERIEQLIQALVEGGIDIPPDPTVTRDE